MFFLDEFCAIILAEEKLKQQEEADKKNKEPEVKKPKFKKGVIR